MLVLSRKRGQAITIGCDIKIVVCEIRGDKVRLGIEAEPSIPIERDDIIKTKSEHERNGE